MMKIKFKKTLKIIIAVLSLITVTVSTAPTVVSPAMTQAKTSHAKVHKHKKAKKKKSSYLVVKTVKDFKPGYKYTYSFKKNAYIGRKIKNYRPVNQVPKVQKANSNYPVPTVKNFTAKLLNKYHVKGFRWPQTKITYNDSALSAKQQQLTAVAIKQINKLKIVKLTRSTGKANITFELGTTTENKLGSTEVEYAYKYKNIGLIDQADITIYNGNITANSNYDLLFNYVVLHEVGHALGLDHNEYDKHEIMAPSVNDSEITTNDNLHPVVDQDYINALAVLYQN
ncbi:matrixin family metalloprotease [Lactobacillus xylocopicola]|uniref:Peptidase metallopeptidase domain-containing protein n=1 Tax=Lactobacillus xylocopicola TaxID=2976676 RepID=A0ABN6SJH6_9LACO|nr:matrixin family metalloprotease [Lactobacillus xylocopicola]BDR59773.1 hypothetical protein KIM322_00340 [Lactobacillus xylocopicola]